MSKEAMKLALEALELITSPPTEALELALNNADNAITALREALAEQPAQQRTEELLEIFKDVDQCGPLLGMGQPAQPQQEAWEHHAKKLTQWLYCMSYSDSYFGEPAGLVKQVTGELNRLIGTSPPAQRKPLTDEEITAIEEGIWKPEFFDDTERQANREFARAIEAAHGIKENT